MSTAVKNFLTKSYAYLFGKTPRENQVLKEALRNLENAEKDKLEAEYLVELTKDRIVYYDLRINSLRRFLFTHRKE